MERRRWTYKKQLLFYFTGVFFLFALLLVIFQLRSERNYKQKMLEFRLSAYSDIVSKSRGDYGAVVTKMPDDLRVTVMDLHGDVLFDSVKDKEGMDNHASRPEVRSALHGMQGYSIRTSDSTGIPYFYFAKFYGDIIIRVALPYELDVKHFFRPDFIFLILAFLIFIVALFTVLFLADKFGQGVARLHNLAEAAKTGSVDYDRISFPDSELGDIGVTMLESYRRLDESNKIIALEKERLALHIHYYDEGIAIFSPEKKKVYANPKFIQYVNTLLDRPTPDLNDIWKSPVFAPLEEFLAGNSYGSSDSVPVFPFKVRKGARDYGIRLLVYPDGGFEITINDVSAAEKNRLVKQQMTNNIAHELRTPVSSIRGYLETLVTCGDISPERRQMFLDRAYAQVMRLSDLIRDIALITKIEEAPEQLAKEKLNLKSVTDEIFEEFRETIEREDMKVENLLPDNLEITGNASLIYAILCNLVEISVKFAVQGVTLLIECYAKGDGYCHLTYYDTGKGVSEEHLAKIFERFYRISEGRTRDAGGSGLGLSIVRNAIAFHKGDVRAVNRRDGGLEFLFSLSEK